jgi:hypothetical protein
MSIRFKNAAGLQTASNTVIAWGQNRASVAFRLRINNPPALVDGDSSGWYFFKRNNTVFMKMFDKNVTTQIPQVIIQWGTTSGNTYSTPTLNPNVVNHIAFTFDKDDPSLQAVYVNGVKTLLRNPKDQPLFKETAGLVLGVVSDSATYQRDFELESFLVLNDYAMTLDDVYHHMNGDDVASIGGSASWRGHWPLVGTKGAVPASGDLGLANAIDGSWPFTPYIGPTTPGTSLTYGDPMPFVSQAIYDTPLVCSSGKSIQVAVKLASTGAPLAVSAGSTTIMPTIRINGGSPITLERPICTGSHYGILYFLPKGYQVQKGDSVTFSVADGWFSTGFGAASGTTDLAAVNRAGLPKYNSSPATMRVGYNYTGPAVYWSYEWSPKNWALRLDVDNSKGNPPALRTDGTAAVNIRPLLNTTSSANAIDRTGTPLPLGLWAVGWDDANPASAPTLMTFIKNGGGLIVERPEYRNDGDASGVGKVAVFEVKKATWTASLTAACGSGDAILTLDSTANAAGKDSSGNAVQWIKIDDEYMEIMTVNAAAKQITVNRPLFGSTAASHAAGATATISHYNLFPTIYFDVWNKNGTPNYSNLVIYPPGDWTVPDTPGPVVLDRSPSAKKGIGKFIMDSLNPGVGVTRHMDSTPTFNPVCEVEDMRQDSDAYWAGQYKSLNRFNIASTRPMDPTTSPYVISHCDGEEFTATLGAAIATAPPARTVETITITDAVAVNLTPGQRLKIDDEIMQVRDVAGTQVQVVRGSGRTTPTTHAAGPITVRYRVPITSTSQYRTNDAVAFELITATPHKLRSNVWFSTPTYTDQNTLARIDVTLTAAVTSNSQTVFSVSAATGDWLYLAPGLHIVFDSEEVIVSSADKTAGTITVARGKNSTTAANHASGTVGKGRSPGVFCVSLDGTRYAWTEQIGWGQNFLVTGPNSLLVNIGVDMGGQPGLHVGNQTWDPTPVMSSGLDLRSYKLDLPGRSYSIEHTAKVTAQCPGAFHWLCIPMTATDDLADFYAEKVRDNLPAGKHKVVVEVANEVWNWVFPFNAIIAKLGQLFGIGSIDWWVRRTKQITDRVRAVFAEQGREAEVLLALPYQTGGVGTVLARARALGVDVDVVSTAPYFRPNNTQAHLDAFNNSDDEQGNDIWIWDMEFDGSGKGQTNRNDGASRRLHESITGRPLLFIHYEGGVDHCLPVPSSGMTSGALVNGFARNLDQNYNPNRYNVSWDYIYVLNRTAGSDGIALFNHCQCPAGPLTGGGYYAMWGDFEYNGQQAGRGDGSDGKANNLLCRATPGLPNSKHPTVNMAENVVSVRGQAVLDYQAKYVADQGGSDPDPQPENQPAPARIPTRVSRRRRRHDQPIVAMTKAASAVTPPPDPPAPLPTVGRPAHVRTTIR